MPELRLGSQRLQVASGTNLLQALLDAGEPVAHSCRAGACHACLVRARPGQAPKPASEPLSAELRGQGWLLSCQCAVEQDMDLELLDRERWATPARVISRELLEPDLLRLRVSPELPLRFRAGQHLLIWLDDRLARPYSIASLPGDQSLEFHIRLHPHGQFGRAVGTLPVGARLWLGQASGALGFDAAWLDRPILLLASGTGLAPLQAIARHALHEGHTTAIDLWHWSSSGHCYLRSELEGLHAKHPNFRLHQRHSDGLEADLRQLRLASRTTLALVCGSPAFTERLRRPLFMAGLPGRQVIGEAFFQAPDHSQLED